MEKIDHEAMRLEMFRLHIDEEVVRVWQPLSYVQGVLCSYYSGADVQPKIVA